MLEEGRCCAWPYQQVNTWTIGSMLSYRFWLHRQYLLQILVQSDFWENVRTLTGFDVELINFGSTTEPLVYKYLAQWPTTWYVRSSHSDKVKMIITNLDFGGGTIDWAWLRHETRRMRTRPAYGETRPDVHSASPLMSRSFQQSVMRQHDVFRSTDSRWVLGWMCIIGRKRRLCDLICGSAVMYDGRQQHPAPVSTSKVVLTTNSPKTTASYHQQRNRFESANLRHRRVRSSIPPFR